MKGSLDYSSFGFCMVLAFRVYLGLNVVGFQDTLIHKVLRGLPNVGLGRMFFLRFLAGV